MSVNFSVRYKKFMFSVSNFLRHKVTGYEDSFFWHFDEEMLACLKLWC